MHKQPIYSTRVDSVTKISEDEYITSLQGQTTDTSGQISGLQIVTGFFKDGILSC
jgi:hypothetical protein